MSAMVGFFILAIFKPMWEMANIMWHAVNSCRL